MHNKPLISEWKQKYTHLLSTFLMISQQLKTPLKQKTKPITTKLLPIQTSKQTAYKKIIPSDKIRQKNLSVSTKITKLSRWYSFLARWLHAMNAHSFWWFVGWLLFCLVLHSCILCLWRLLDHNNLYDFTI